MNRFELSTRTITKIDVMDVDEIKKDTGEEVAMMPPETTAPESTEAAAATDLLPADTEASSAEAAPPKFSDTFKERIKSAYPEDEFADDETYFQKASEQLDNLEQYRNNNMEANKALMAIFDAEPAIPEVLKDMIEGASFPEAISRHFSPEELTPKEGDPDLEGWKRNSEARMKRLEANELANKTRQENDEFTKAQIQEFASENNLSPEKAEEILTKVGETLDEVYSGKISKSFLNSMYKALNYENDVQNASATGEIKGRNEKIVAQKEEKPKGDGLPVLNNSKKADPPVKSKSWVDTLIDSEKKKQIL